MNLTRLSIATKLWSFILFVVMAIASVAGVGLVRSAAILSEGRAAQATATDMVHLATQWAYLTETQRVRAQAATLVSDAAQAAALRKEIQTGDGQLAELHKAMSAMPLPEDDRAQLTRLSQSQNAGAGDSMAARKDFVARQVQRVAEIQGATEARRQANTGFILAGLLAIVAIILLATRWLINSIRTPLQAANELAARIAKGDLSKPLHTERQDEFGSLLCSLGTMNESLRGMVAQIRHGTDSIATASAEIAGGNNDLAQRTEKTSGNLQATASSMDQLTATVRDSAENSRQASSLAGTASSVAQRGGDVVRQVVTTMQEIDGNSKKIADIIGVIDGIAFQTNILALNAAVEAARAGEQGRGFAVVASEVRSLAQRSAEAAREIKTLISTSVEKVESGTRLVTDAGSTMEEIVQSVQRVAQVISDITSAANLQSDGIAGVNRSINDLDQMTQQNAALVEQSAAAADSLREQAHRMKDVVSVFRLEDGFDKHAARGGTSALPA
jgi:methyl-accepting chemotaxis protein